MLLPQKRRDKKTAGMQSDEGILPWRDPQPMKGFYTCKAGFIPHSLATDLDARRPLFMQSCDNGLAFILTEIGEAGLTASKYYELCQLSSDPQCHGPPGTQAKHGNTEPSESR